LGLLSETLNPPLTRAVDPTRAAALGTAAWTVARQWPHTLMNAAPDRFRGRVTTSGRGTARLIRPPAVVDRRRARGLIPAARDERIVKPGRQLGDGPIAGSL
jgi:hypothetical protein